MSSIKISGVGKDARADYVLIKFKHPKATAKAKRRPKTKPTADAPRRRDAREGPFSEREPPDDIDGWIRLSKDVMSINGNLMPPEWENHLHAPHGELETVIRRWPERFPHVRRKPLRKKIVDWQAIFPYLLASFGGTLPDADTMVRLGYAQLLYYMGKYPEKFPVTVEPTRRAEVS